MSIPVIGSIVGTVGGILLIKMLTGKKSHPAPARPRLSGLPGGLVNSSMFRFIIEILITLAFPSLKKLGFDLANKKSSACSNSGAIDGSQPGKGKTLFLRRFRKWRTFYFLLVKKGPFPLVCSFISLLHSKHERIHFAPRRRIS